MKTIIAFYEQEGKEFVPVVTFHSMITADKLTAEDIEKFRNDAKEMGFDVVHHEVREGTEEARQELLHSKIPVL